MDLKIPDRQADTWGMKIRTDPHRPGAIVISDYTLIDYFGVMTFPDESGEGCDKEAYGTEAMDQYAAGPIAGIWPHQDKCDVCGACFVHGALLRHEPTGLFLTIGQVCATKYFCIAGLRKGERASRALVRIRRRQAKAKNRIMLAKNPGINAALKTDHYISRDLRDKAIRWGGLSDRQIVLAFKLVADVAKREAEKADAVPAPEGRFEVTGEIVCIKTQDGFYGPQEKMLVKIKTEGGHWKAWGTYPSSLAAARGDTVKFTATFERSDKDEDFAFFKRPTKAHEVTP